MGEGCEVTGWPQYYKKNPITKQLVILGAGEGEALPHEMFLTFLVGCLGWNIHICFFIFLGPVANWVIFLPQYTTGGQEGKPKCKHVNIVLESS